ncbi:MAG: transposase [Chloroflexota bacterium]|nr:transposase [Chloroflexota bacterium]
MVRGPKRRRSLRLQGYDYSQPGAYFVTICTRNRLPIFGRVDQGRMLLNNCGKIATRKWERLHERFPEIEIDEFIVMPDHMHGIIVIPDPAVGAIHAGNNSVGENHAGAIHAGANPIGASPVGANHDLPIHELPRLARRRMTLPMVIGFYKMNTAKAINIVNDTRGTPVWQRNYYEHIIRNEDALNRIRRYIQENPIKWPVDPENRNRASE